MRQGVNRLGVVVCVALTCSALVKLYSRRHVAPAPLVMPAASTVKLHEGELVGQWEPDAATQTRLTKLGVVTIAAPTLPRIELQPHGYRLERVPYWDNQKLPRLFLAAWTGGWNFYGWHNTALYLYGGEVDGRGQVLGERPAYKLSITVGAPASNEPLLFTKRPSCVKQPLTATA